MAQSEIKIEVLKTEMSMIKEQNDKDHAEIKNMLCELKQDLKDFKVDCDGRYAPKWIANFVYAIIIMIVSGIVGGAISLLFR